MGEPGRRALIGTDSQVTLGAVVKGRVGVVVVCRRVQTAHEDAGAVVDRRQKVVVQSGRIGTTRDQTGTIVVGGVRVVVGGKRKGTSAETRAVIAGVVVDVGLCYDTVWNKQLCLNTQFYKQIRTASAPR